MQGVHLDQSLQGGNRADTEKHRHTVGKVTHLGMQEGCVCVFAETLRRCIPLSVWFFPESKGACFVTDIFPLMKLHTPLTWEKVPLQFPGNRYLVHKVLCVQSTFCLTKSLVFKSSRTMPSFTR